MCWGVGEVRGDLGKGEWNEVREMWGSVLGSHTLTHFPTPPPFLYPHPFPHANTLPHPTHLSLSTNTLSYTSPTPPIPLPTAPLTSPYTPNTLPHSHHALFHITPHIFHSFDYVAKLPCGDVILINLTGNKEKHSARVDGGCDPPENNTISP